MVKVYAAAKCFIDRRDPRYMSLRSRRWRASGFFDPALGYADLNDHDELRWDSVWFPDVNLRRASLDREEDHGTGRCQLLSQNLSS